MKQYLKIIYIPSKKELSKIKFKNKNRKTFKTRKQKMLKTKMKHAY